MKILAIVGSIRADSFNYQLAQLAQEIVEKEGTFEILEYAGIPFMNQDIEHPAPAPITRIRKQIDEADGIWFFTPEYNHAVPGVLKNLIDWLSRPVNSEHPSVLIGKPAAVSGASVGMSGTLIAQDQLITLISFLNMKVMNNPRLTIPNITAQAEGDHLILRDSMPYLKRQANAFLKFITENQ